MKRKRKLRPSIKYTLIILIVLVLGWVECNYLMAVHKENLAKLGITEETGK